MWTNLYRAGATLLLVLIGLQAVIAGQHIFGTWGIDVHAALGNAAFSIAVVLGLIAVAKLDNPPVALLSLVVIILISAQIGLGYSSRNSAAAAAIHIPLGVATFGAVTYQLLAAWPRLVVKG